MLSPETTAQITHSLSTQTAQPFAFLADGETIYFSSGDRPVISLIQAIYDHHSDHARRILRSRIYTPSTIAEAEKGMVKVSAKRISARVIARDHAISLDSFRFKGLEPLAPPPLLGLADLSEAARAGLLNQTYMQAAFAVAAEIPRKKELYESDRKIATILVSEAGDFIAASRNANAKNRTRHAEVNLVQGLLREKRIRIPSGSRIYVTLKCCKMCAGMIWDHAEDVSKLRVFYGENDPGPNARNTAFDRAVPPLEFQENVSY